MTDCCKAKAEARKHGVFEGPVGDDWFHDTGPPCRGEYEAYVAAVTRRGPYNVLTYEYWINTPKPIIHPKLGVINS